MKKQVRFLVLLALLGAFVFLLEGCGDECEGSKRTSAEFKVYNELYYFDKENGKIVEKLKLVEEDTFMLSYVTFEAIDPNAQSYEWTVGSDPKKRTDKKFTLFFDKPGVISENPLPIKLKVTKAPNTKCFPNDTGIDSVIHKIYFLPRDKWPVYGKYFGYDNTNPNEKYTIEIFAGFMNGYYTTDSLKNLPNNCSKLPLGFRSGTAFEFAISRTSVVFNNQIYPFPNCVFRDYDRKIGYLKPNRMEIVIEYEFTDRLQQNESLQKRIFTGIRQ
jgi:hypothetical protein